MNNLDEQYENLYDFIKNLEILLRKNVFDNQKIEEISVFGKDVLNLVNQENSILTRMISCPSILLLNCL